MSHAEQSVPEPTPEDERRGVALAQLIESTKLQASPNGDEQCGRCLYYLTPHQELAYCWHPEVAILVGDDWWCRHWEAKPA